MAAGLDGELDALDSFMDRSVWATGGRVGPSGWASPTPSEEDAVADTVRLPDDVVPVFLAARARARRVTAQMAMVSKGRSRAVDKIDANLMQGLSLGGASEEGVPDQIRQWMRRNLLRVRDVFHQFDDDGNGKIDRREFSKALRELGFEGLEEGVNALFKSIDVDGSKAIDYREFHALLEHSHMAHPHIAPLSRKTMNARTHRKESANMMQGLRLDATSEAEVPDQIRMWMQRNLLRVRDVFQQLDDDGNGKVDRQEFRKALSELGFQAPRAALDAVFHSFDVDGSKAIDYRELHDLLVRSVQSHPHLPPLPTTAANSVALRRLRLEKNDANLLQGLKLDENDMSGAVAQIRARMQKGLLRVIDVFRQLDDDESGLIDRAEFGKALREMGCEASGTVVDSLFKDFDLNRNFVIEYDELHSVLSVANARRARRGV